jgi:hypothetical protein
MTIARHVPSKPMSPAWDAVEKRRCHWLGLGLGRARRTRYHGRVSRDPVRTLRVHALRWVVGAMLLARAEVALGGGVPIENERQAVERMREEWRTEVAPTLSPEERARWQPMFDQGLWSAAPIPCARAAEHIVEVLGPAEPRPIFGSLARLRARERCWQVGAALGFVTLLGYLDPARGELLLVWSPPEG